MDMESRVAGVEGMAGTKRVGTAAAMALMLAACQPEIINRGYQVDPRALEQIRPGSSAEQVVLVLGTPSTVSTVGSRTYYYVSQRLSRPVAFLNETVRDQSVIAIYLDNRNRVERVANYGLQDGVVFDFISRTTPTGGEELSFLRQLLRASNLNPLSGGSGSPQPGM
jgi:outer membrane protein assembly factor BamE (lipoprotein component of BamABCDE complex)